MSKYTQEVQSDCPVCDGTGLTTIIKSATGDMVKKLRDRGKTYQAIANDLHIPISTVHYHIKGGGRPKHLKRPPKV